MAKNIDLDKLKKEGLAEEFLVLKQGTAPNPLLPGDPTPFKKIPFEKGNSRLEVTFALQAYQELGLKIDDVVTFGSDKKRWRVEKMEEAGKEITVFFALA